ncbi:MAG: YbaY family lipoprotein [Pirellula sp.]
MRILKALVLLLSLEFGVGSCYAQMNWLDIVRGAQPRVNLGVPPGVPASTPNFPQTSVDPNAPSYPSSGGYGAPMLVPNRKDWKLGVYVQNTEVGAVVTQVAPGSAGQQAGLEPNDVIVAVSSSRIGIVDNRPVELADEIRRNTDAYGRVSLLVFDSRQRMLQNIPVSMNSNSSAIAGSVALRDRIQLPFGSLLTVQIQNASKPFYEINGGKSVIRVDGTGPFAFELNCDPRYIDPRDQYQVYASISSGNQELYRLAQPVPVNPSALGQPLVMVLDRSTYGADGTSNPFPGGNVINAGYPSLDVNQLNQLFVQLLGRNPSNREILAWQAYLQQGNSINDLKVKLLSSAQFRERFGSENSYIQQLITSVYGRVPNQQELAFWMGRLQATGSPESVVTEMLSRSR